MANMEYLYREVGHKIKTRREQCGLTQEALASQVSLTRTSITNIEKGRQKFLLHTLIDIANALSVPPATLLPMDDDLDAKLKGLPAQAKKWIKNTVITPTSET